MGKKINILIKNLQFITIIFLCMIGFLSIAFEFGGRVIGIKKNTHDTVKSANINFAEKFPFPDQIDCNKNDEEDIVETSGLDKYLNFVSDISTQLGNAKYYIWNYYKFLELNGAIDKLIGINLFDGETKVVKLNDGRLAWYEDSKTTEKDNKEIVDVVENFSQYVKEHDSNFLYVQTPCAIDPADEQLPVGVVDYANSNYDLFCNELQDRKMDVLDLRVSIAESEYKNRDLFFKTDHHWTVDGGFLACKWITEYMNEKYDLKLDTTLLDKKLYSRLTLDNKNLGAEGRKVSAGYVEAEPFDLLIPKFDTDLVVEHPAIDLKLEGSFKDVMYDWDIFNEDNYYEVSYYEAQLYGNQPLSIIHNNKAENNTKIMMIRNSFSLAVAPYLSLLVEDLYLIDYRVSCGFNGSYRAVIDQFAPDMVILMTIPNKRNLFQFTQTGCY